MNAKEKFFYVQKIKGVYYVTLTNGLENFPLRPHGLGEDDCVLSVGGADGALRSIQLYNRRNQTNYLVSSKI